MGAEQRDWRLGRETAPSQSAPGQSRKKWIIIGIIAAVLFWGAALAFLFIIRGFVLNAVGPPKQTTQAYYAALGAHDWPTAFNLLDASLRSTLQPADLETMWLQREQAHGPLDLFTIDGAGVANARGKTAATGKVNVRLHWRDGASETISVSLVRENGEWKLSRIP